MIILLASISVPTIFLALYVGAFSLPEVCTGKGENISSPRNWACIWYNFENLTCWFDLEKIFNQQIEPGIKYFSINYSINGFYKVITIPAEKRCVKIYDPTENYGVCTFNLTMEFSDTRRPLSKIIEFNNTQLAKLSPVRGVQYNTTTSSVVLHIPLARVEYEREIRIRYRSEFDRQNEYGWKELLDIWKKDYNSLFANIYNSDFSDFSHDLTLTNLTAFTIYDVRIDLILCDKGSRTGYWSDALRLAIRTDDDVPVDVPEFPSGFFMQMNSSCVQIFWKPIPREKQCGIITDYRLRVTSGRKEEKQAEILIPPEKISHIVRIYPNEINRIRLSQRTRHGYPIIPDAIIFVFPKTHRPKLPKIYTIEKLNNSHVLMTWEEVEEDNMVSITVVWCRGTLPGYCFEPLESNTFQLAYTNARTVALNSTDYLSYIYGISVETISKEGLLISSGIQWYMDCLYHKYGIPNKAPHLNISHFGHSRVLVKWKPYTCEESVGRIKFYLLRYCPERNGSCSGNATLIKIQPGIYSYVITSLKGGNSYIIQVGTRLNRSNGPWSKQVILKLPEKKASGKIPLVIGSATGGMTAFVILILLTVYVCRRYCKKADADTRDIHPPKIQENNSVKTTSNKTDASGDDSGLGGSGDVGSNFENNGHLKHQSASSTMLNSGRYRDVNPDSGGYREVSLHYSDDDGYDDMSDVSDDQYPDNFSVATNDKDESENSHQDETTELICKDAYSSSNQNDIFKCNPLNEVDCAMLTDCLVNSQHQRNYDDEYDNMSEKSHSATLYPYKIKFDPNEKDESDYSQKGETNDFELPSIDSYSKEGYGSF